MQYRQPVAVVAVWLRQYVALPLYTIRLARYTVLVIGSVGSMCRLRGYGLWQKAVRAVVTALWPHCFAMSKTLAPRHA